MRPGAIRIVLGPLLSVKLKSGGASVGGVLVVLELTELAVEEVAAALEDMEVPVDVVLDEAFVLAEEALCEDRG